MSHSTSAGQLLAMVVRGDEVAPGEVDHTGPLPTVREPWIGVERRTTDDRANARRNDALLDGRHACIRVPLSGVSGATGHRQGGACRLHAGMFAHDIHGT